MIKYFMEDKELAEIEKIMMMIPNFEPRYSGIYLKQKKKPTYGDMVYECFGHIKNRRLRERIFELTKNYTVFLDEEHKNRISSCCTYLNHLNILHNKLMATIFLITTSDKLLNCALEIIENSRFDFKKINLKEISIDDYIIYKCAKTIYTGKDTVSADELADSQLVSEHSLNMIVNANLILYYGYEFFNKVGEK